MSGRARIYPIKLTRHEVPRLHLEGGHSSAGTAQSGNRDLCCEALNNLYGDKLGATDGDIGHVKDFYFDDQNWALRYLVVDTGSWLPGRQVLLSPHSLGHIDQANKILRLNLTRKQIEESPSIDSHQPVSRQYEEEYYQYFGWP